MKNETPSDIICYLDQPDVRDMCVQQHMDSLPNPHKAIGFCDAHPEWSEDIDTIAPDGSQVSTAEPLQHEVDGITRLYLDESRPK